MISPTQRSRQYRGRLVPIIEKTTQWMNTIFRSAVNNKVNISSDSKAEAKKGKEKDCEKESLFGVYFWQQCSRSRPFICRELNLIAQRNGSWSDSLATRAAIWMGQRSHEVSPTSASICLEPDNRVLRMKSSWGQRAAWCRHRLLKRE